MKLRRTKTTIDAVQTPLEQPPLGDSQPEPDLAALSLDEFMAEARRRGFVPVPRDGWELRCVRSLTLRRKRSSG